MIPILIKFMHVEGGKIIIISKIIIVPGDKKISEIEAHCLNYLGREGYKSDKFGDFNKSSIIDIKIY